jgi:hypothetical protein
MAANHIQTPSGITPSQIQSIFNETISKIINLVAQEPSITPTTTGTSNTGNEPGKMPNPHPKDNLKLSAEMIPILQTFLLNIQIYHTATFNGIINGISSVINGQSLITGGDINQPSVSHKWQPENNISAQENVLSGFASMELNDTRPINLLSPDKSVYQPRSVASQETRHFWEQPRAIHQQTYNSPSQSYVQSNQSNYDEFLKHYTDEFAKFHNTYVDDSSEGENEDNWKSPSEYVSESACPDLKPEQPSETAKTGFEALQYNGTQCCARLSKYMKYRIADLADDFVKSYPPDTYIEGGFIFGKPCLNNISLDTENIGQVSQCLGNKRSEDKGGFFCQEHLNDAGVEDIRQPRPDITYDRDNGKDDNLEIVFSNEGYKASSNDKPSTANLEGFDYYGKYDPNYSASGQINSYYSATNTYHGDNDTFSNNHQCCARLNKFRLYRIELEPTNFLDTYPADVYIEDGCIYGTACQNLISNESYNAGIRFCIEHESDPYVDNICEPMIIKSKLTKHNTQSLLNTTRHQTTENHSKKSNPDLAETETIPNENSARTIRRSAKLNQTGSYEWDKYNTDFIDLC